MKKLIFAYFVATIFAIISCNRSPKIYSNEDAYSMLQQSYPNSIVWCLPNGYSNQNHNYIGEFIVSDSTNVFYVKVTCYDTVKVINKLIIKK